MDGGGENKQSALPSSSSHLRRIEPPPTTTHHHQIAAPNATGIGDDDSVLLSHFLRMANSLNCPYAQAGCDWVGPVKDMQSHLSDNCAFALLRCPNQCHLRNKTMSMNKRRQRTSDDQKDENESMMPNPKRARRHHNSSSSSVAITDALSSRTSSSSSSRRSCDADDGHDDRKSAGWFLRSQLSSHREVCEFEEIECLEKCGATSIKRCEMEKHLRE